MFLIEFPSIFMHLIVEMDLFISIESNVLTERQISAKNKS